MKAFCFLLSSFFFFFLSAANAYSAAPAVYAAKTGQGAGRESPETEQNTARIEIDKDDRESWSKRIKGVEAHFPKELKMENNRVNISVFIEQLKRAAALSD